MVEIDLFPKQQPAGSLPQRAGVVSEWMGGCHSRWTEGWHIYQEDAERRRKQASDIEGPVGKGELGGFTGDKVRFSAKAATPAAGPPSGFICEAANLQCMSQAASSECWGHNAQTASCRRRADLRWTKVASYHEHDALDAGELV